MSGELEDELVAKNEEEIEGKELKEAEQTALDLVELEPNDAIAWFVKGKTLYMEGNFEEALSCLAQAAQIDKEQPLIWHMIGLCLLPLSRIDEAIEALEYAKASLSKNPDVHLALAVAYALKGKEQQAHDNAKLAYRIDSKKASDLASDFYEKYVGSSAKVEGATKAILERMLEARRVAGINGYSD